MDGDAPVLLRKGMLRQLVGVIAANPDLVGVGIAHFYKEPTAHQTSPDTDHVTGSVYDKDSVGKVARAASCGAVDDVRDTVAADASQSQRAADTSG